jgi:hypothetical protein
VISDQNYRHIPSEEEREKASNSYIISLIAFIGGLPLPIINLFATFIFYFANRQTTFFVRWHCIQALLSQFFVLPLNSAGFWWTISIVFSKTTLSSNYIAYIITLVAYNLVEFIATIHTAIATRKGIHVEWWFFGRLTNLIYKPL